MSKKITKLIAGTLIATSILSLSPTVADAAWKQNSSGWWFTEGNFYAKGWRLLDGKWYYFKPNGYMATGWVHVGSKWYYLNDDGSMATGWKKIGANWYYLYSNGSMATGWLKLGLQWYYLNNDGSMKSNQWVDGIYYVGNSGAMIETQEYKYLLGQTDIDGGQMNERILVAKVDDNTISVKYIYSGYNEGAVFDGYLNKVSGDTYTGKVNQPDDLGYSKTFTVEFTNNELKMVKSVLGISDGAIAQKVK